MIVAAEQLRRRRYTANDQSVNYPLTDCGNAERLVDQHGGGVRYCPELREWFLWNGVVWSKDYGGVTQLAKKTVRAMARERTSLLLHAERNPDDWHVLQARADAIAKWATRSEGASQIAAMVHLAQSDPRICVDADRFDRDPWLLNVYNGTLDLRVATLAEHRPEDLLTKIAAADYWADAKSAKWEQFLNEVFEPHPDVIPFIQKAVGYSLTGDTREECIFVLVGRGRNGKSTFLSTLHHLLGSYGGVAEMDTFLTSRAGYLHEDIADMRGRRFISSQEPMLKGTFAGATLKWLSGGDRLRARRLYQHAQEFEPTHKLWFAANHLPSLGSDDSAAWSRLRVVPFDVSFDDRANRQLKRQLRSEAPGILRWAVQGCLMWQRDGLATSESIDRAANRWCSAQVA